LTDLSPATDVMFNKEFFVFITVHATGVKMWDSNSGTLISVMRNLCKNEITRGVMDNRHRKIFLADIKGKIASFNLNNGSKMKKFSRHTSHVSDMI